VARLAARLGGPRAYEIARAQANLRFWRRAGGEHVRAIRALRRAEDADSRVRIEGHLADLGLARAKHGAYVRWLACLRESASADEARASFSGSLSLPAGKRRR
jgi:hypothetical protein